MFGMNLLNDLFEKEGIQQAKQRQPTVEEVQAHRNKIRDYELQEQQKRWAREEAWGEDCWILQIIVIALMIAAVCIHHSFTADHSADKKIKNTETTPTIVTTVNGEYKMTQREWEDYQYQLQLKEIDDRVERQRRNIYEGR
jgi:hypothetical protein